MSSPNVSVMGLSPEDLVLQYLPFASRLAKYATLKGVYSGDADDLLGSARLGLVEAAWRFDPKFEVDFKTFAFHRIRGAIYDGVRKAGWSPRSNVIKKEFGEFPGREKALPSFTMIRLDSIPEIMLQEEDDFTGIEGKTYFQEITEKIRRALKELPKRQRKIIQLYYFQYKTLEEIGLELGLSKSWTSRLHERTLHSLYEMIS